MSVSAPTGGHDGGSAPVALLSPEGERIPHPEYDSAINSLGDAQYRALYRDMALVRRIDAEATALQRQGELALWASCLGQEAAQIGSARAMRPRDYAFPTYREHGVAWARGIEPTQLLPQFRGVALSGWDPQEYRCAMYSIVIGSQALHATGYAMGIAKDGALGDDGEAAIAYFGDGATSEGDLNESFVFATVFQAPVVFFCQNNGWAISAPTERQSRVPIADRALGFGFPSIRVDGNDVLACYAVTKQALDAARTGQGPVLIEAVTYRMGAHTTSDDPARYRLTAELEAWKLRDPLERLKALLYRQQLADRSWFDELDREADELAARFRSCCLELPDPPPLSMFEHVYADQTPQVQAQQAAQRDYLATLEATEPVQAVRP